jgi:hypothetical protein
MLWAIFYFLQNFPQFTGRWFTGINTLVISAIIFPGLFEIIHLIDLKISLVGNLRINNFKYSHCTLLLE